MAVSMFNCNFSFNRASFCFSYGDTAPKSIPARLYSILWMLLGMVAFSVLTANFTSSLNYEIEKDLNLFGKEVGSLLCSFMQLKDQDSFFHGFAMKLLSRRSKFNNATVHINHFYMLSVSSH